MWTPQIASSGEEIYLGFRDLQEARVAAAFVARGLGAHRVREAIVLARELVGEEHPLSTTRFRSDGRSVFLQLVEAEGETRLIDLFRKQYAFVEMLEKSLTNLEYDATGVPARAFGQPIESETSVPVSALVTAVASEGSEQAAARAWAVPVRAVRRALAFGRDLQAAA